MRLSPLPLILPKQIDLDSLLEPSNFCIAGALVWMAIYVSTDFQNKINYG